jgi:anti-sigma regulatory factor (Ser/Thr protein kinase)
LRLAHDLTAIPQARRLVRRWSTELCVDAALIDDVELIVSELVTNAVIHAVAPYDIDLYRSEGVIRGEVRDASSTAPCRNTSPDHRGGFGLHIVTARSTRWGCITTPDGKEVWFEIDQP